MCDNCQTSPRVIDYPINCLNCGNREVLGCFAVNQTVITCDLWVPDDFYAYHDHYVDFTVPEWERLAKLNDYKESELVDSLICRPDVFYHDIDGNTILTVKERKIKGPATIIVVRREE